MDRTLVEGRIVVDDHEPDYANVDALLSTRRCYRQDIFLGPPRGQLRPGSLVTVKLTIGRARRPLTARVRVSAATDDRDAALAARLRCARGVPERRCKGTVPATHLSRITLEIAGGGATCATARRVMREVGRWATNDGDCYATLCVAGHEMNLGYRCAVAQFGDADWRITCRRGRRFVTATKSE